MNWFIQTKIDSAEYPEDFEDKRAEIVDSIAKTDEQLEKLLNFIYDGGSGDQDPLHAKLVKRAK